MDLPDYMKPFINNSDYDSKSSFYDFYSKNSISVTTLIRPIRSLALEYNNKIKRDNRNIDLNTKLSSSIGDAIHEKIETCIKNNYLSIYDNPLYDKEFKDKIRINPEVIDLKNHNIIMERRFRKKIFVNGRDVEINGKVDLILINQLIDFKTTSVYTYLKQRNFKKYQLQGSIYRWLYPELITKDTLKLTYIFTDWNNLGNHTIADYPSSKILVEDIQLLSLDETEKYIINTLKKLDYAINQELPLCTDEELWKNPDVFKVFKDIHVLNKNGRSLKNFDSIYEANKFKDEKVGRVVKSYPGKYKACCYCSVKDICMQYKNIQSKGLIDC